MNQKQFDKFQQLFTILKTDADKTKSKLVYHIHGSNDLNVNFVLTHENMFNKNYFFIIEENGNSSYKNIKNEWIKMKKVFLFEPNYIIE